jgi:citrate lyase beta subunit
MRHFAHLPDDDRRRLFARQPQEFHRGSEPAVLATALGATLYMPATRPRLADDLERQAASGVLSTVVCLEDAIADDDLPAAEENLVDQLARFARGAAARAERAGDGPLVFVRVRRPDQITDLASRLRDDAGVVSGFVLPKFTEASGAAFLDALTDAAASTGHRLLAMPVLESPEIIHRETRQDALLGVQRMLEKYRASVLAVRIGATDLCAVYGIRRDRDLTVYDVRVVADVITDVVNVLGRADGTGYVVTGPVWEYFGGHERMFKPQLREAPFEAHDADDLRATLLRRDLDGLLREVVLDKANGLTGKTVIHPSHVAVVHALSVVTHEEFADARDIAGTGSGGGAGASSYRNKMNEAKPHRTWAERTLQRAAVFGVAAEDVGFVDLLAAGTVA